MTTDSKNIVNLDLKKDQKILNFSDFQKQSIKFDINKLQEAYNQIVQTKKFDDGGGISHFGAICLTRIPEVVRDVNIDEAAYSEFIPDYENTYFKEVFDVLSSKYKLGRVRILLKEPRSTLSWHRDPEPRLHIPIITNPGCLMVIDNVAKHMPADGSVWITNNTKYHNAFNGGEENRIHLVACVLDYKFN